ncbi:MAG TPA: acetoin dehydrogenase dihydrolipoyllysine-residue acetyltransferase subunit [Stellaceae bacterium]|nr:acetoin dehydrogenase dihydrolipoyllysine-residue acetyltransferase subunit [Stellaceae bacterium]
MSQITALTMPKWGLTMTEGKVVRWLKREGEGFAAGEEVIEIETTKITNVVEMPEAGKLRRIVASEGATLPVGALLAVVAPESVGDSEIEAFVAGFAPVEAAAETVESAGPQARLVEAGGRRLNCLELGEGGVPVLLLHGFGADLQGWMFLQPALAEGRRTIALDLPGHGGSQKELDGADEASFAADVDRLLAALDIERVHLVGHSMGGGIALTFAAWQPDRVASLTLIASAQLGPEINAAFIDGFVKAQRRREMQEVLSLLVHDPSQMSRQMVEDVLRYKRLDGVQAALEEIAAEWFPNGVQRVGNAEVAASLPMPVQLIWGREDRIIPVGHAEALAARLPVHILPETGHLPHMEKAGEVARLVKSFIAG